MDYQKTLLEIEKKEIKQEIKRYAIGSAKISVPLWYDSIPVIKSRIKINYVQ